MGHYSSTVIIKLSFLKKRILMYCIARPAPKESESYYNKSTPEMISLGSLASDVRIKQLFSKVIQFHYSHLTIVTDKNLPSKKIEKRTTQEGEGFSLICAIGPAGVR